MFFSKELGFAKDYRSKTIEAHDVANRSEVMCILCIKSRPSVCTIENRVTAELAKFFHT